MSFFERDAADLVLQARYHALLSADERVRTERFHFAHDRLRHLVTRALVRVVLSRYVAMEPQAWRFEAGDHGRPVIANADPGCAGLGFNVSHTRGLIALAVSRGGALGVDTENLAVRGLSDDVLRGFLSNAERAALAALPAERRATRAFEYWTFKEAYAKARGLGLGLPFECCEFSFPSPGRVALRLDPSLGDRAGRWRLWQLRPSDEHLVAVCATRDAGAAGLRVREIVPLVSETQAAVEPTLEDG